MSVQSLVQDPDFAKLSPQDKKAVLAGVDPEFSKIGDNEVDAVVQGIRGSTPAAPQTALQQLGTDLKNSNGVLGTANTLLKAPEKMSSQGLQMLAGMVPNPAPTGNLPMDVAKGAPRVLADTVAKVAPGFISKGAILTAGALKGVQAASPVLKLLAKEAGAQAESMSGAFPGSLEAAYKAPALSPLQLQAGKSAAAPMYEAAKAEMQGASIFKGMSDPKQILATAQDYLSKGGTLEPAEALTARKATDILLKSRSVVKDELIPLRSTFDQMAKQSSNIAEADPAYIKGRMADSLRQIIPQNMHGGASAFKMAVGTALNSMGPVGKAAKFALSPAALGAAATVAGDASKAMSPLVQNPAIGAAISALKGLPLTIKEAMDYLRKAKGDKNKARQMATADNREIPE